MKRIKFSVGWDLMFDYRGITHLPSGSFNPAKMPDQARLIVQNVEVTTATVSAALCAAAAVAADKGEKALSLFVAENYEGADERAKHALYFALHESE